MTKQEQDKAVEDYYQLKMKTREASFAYILFVIFIILASVFVGWSIMFIIINISTIFANHPYIINYIGAGIFTILCYKFNIKVQHRLNDYVTLDWYLIRNLTYFILTILGITSAALYICNLLIN